MCRPYRPGTRRSRQRRSNRIAPIIDAMPDAPPKRQKQRIHLWLASLVSLAGLPSFQQFTDSMATCALLGTAGGIFYEAVDERRNTQTPFLVLLFSTTLLLHTLLVLSSIIQIIATAYSTSPWFSLLLSICCIAHGSLVLTNEPSSAPPSFEMLVMVGCVARFGFIYFMKFEREIRMYHTMDNIDDCRATGATHDKDDAGSRAWQTQATIVGMKRRATRLLRKSILLVPLQAKPQQGNKETSSASVAALGHAGGIRILSFDGGGNRIATALWILEHVESIMGSPTWLHAYDYIGGISAGAIIAVLASDPKVCETAIANFLKRPCRNWAGDMRQVMIQCMSTCFSTIKIWRLICRGHLLDVKVLNALLRRTITTQSFKHQPRTAHAMVLATRVGENRDLVEHVIANYPQPMAPRSPQLDEYIDQVLVGRPYERSTGWARCKAVAASMCVPVMSPPIIHQMRPAPGSPIGPQRFHDGGLICNMPAAHCVAEATKLWPGVPINCVHSFGTGSGAHLKGANKSALRWLIAMATPRNDEDHRFAQLKALMPRLEELRQESQNLMPGVLKVDQHPPRPPCSMIRINVDGDLADRFNLTVSNAEDMEAMRRATLQYVADNSEMIDQIIKDVLF